MNYPKEFTYQEYEAFIKDNKFESFTKSQVDAFNKDLLEKSKKGSIDDFELNCGIAEFHSLNEVVVINEDLTKSLMYWREPQIESVEIPDGIFKSIDDKACHRFRDTPLNRLKGIAGLNCADKDAIEKSRIGDPIGATRMWNGKTYIKTPNGWRPKGAKYDNTSKKLTDEQKKTAHRMKEIEKEKREREIESRGKKKSNENESEDKH